MPWHRTPLAGIFLRLAGAILLGIAWLSGRALFGGGPIAAPDAIDALLALILFVAASAGSALTTLGAHLFDPVTLSRRWATFWDD